MPTALPRCASVSLSLLICWRMLHFRFFVFFCAFFVPGHSLLPSVVSRILLSFLFAPSLPFAPFVPGVCQAIRTGMIWVNCWLKRDLRVPFGGVHDSGIGREGGKLSIDFYSELKNICIQIDALPAAKL